MRGIISYDISNDKRRRQVVKRLQKCAVRVQYSVFEGELSETSWRRLWKDLNELINPSTDGLMWLSICGNCGNGRLESGTTGRLVLREDEVL